MKELNNDEILKIDEILLFLNLNKNYSYNDSFLAEKFKISIEEYEFLYNSIIEFSTNELNIGRVLDQGKVYATLQCNYSTSRFIESGGFKKHFENKKKEELKGGKFSEQNITAHNLIINNGKAKSIKQKTQPEKKTRWDILGIVGVFIALVTLIFGDNMCEKLSKNNESIKSIEQMKSKEITNYSKKINLPYLESIPILDKGLFIQHHYSEFIIGGPNIYTLKINARKENGGKTEIKKSEENNLIFQIFENPYIEFYYKSEYYSLQIQDINMGESFDCIIKKIKSPTLNLIDYKKV